MGRRKPPALISNTGNAHAARSISSGPLHYGLCERSEARKVLPKIPRSIYRQHSDLTQAFTLLQSEELHWPLYLWGAVGVGKTFGVLAEMDWIDDRYDLWFGSVTSLSRAYAEVQLKENDVKELIASLWRCDLVGVDELGLKTPSDHVLEALTMLADARGRRPTVWISNLSPSRLVSTYDDRLASRLLCGTVLELSGVDQRMT
jgi:chromosomal replication initiation ATPase DnaA